MVARSKGRMDKIRLVRISSPHRCHIGHLLTASRRQVEKELNSFPQYKMQVNDLDCDFDIHFVGLFSEKPDAVPIILLHGWPGSFLEFLPMLELLQTKYTPQTLPYHIIVPSWPGYAFSSPPPLDRDFKTEDVARIFNKLMIQLGFASGYVAQGGDLGSKLARILAVTYPEAKAAHLNYCYMQKPSSISKEEYSAAEVEGLKRNETFTTMGSAYGLEQATKPSTIGLALSTSPLALLSWLGEKYLDWSDESPSLDEILKSVSLYWLTECFATTIYPYRERFTGQPGAGNPKFYITKPMAFSWFPKEIGAVPRAWIETTGNLVYFNEHKRGGHFAALEQPEALLGDLEAFVAAYYT